MITISDPDDPRLAAYRSIKERDLLGRQDKFIAEGKVVLNVLLSQTARFDIESILVLENKLAGIAELLSRCPADVPIYSASQSVMDSVAGYNVHRGILAIGTRSRLPDLARSVQSIGAGSPVVVLCGISNHDNVGSIFRNAAAFDAAYVFLDETCCDPLYRKAIRVSVGAALQVPYFHGGSIDEILAALMAQGFKVLALSPSSPDSIYDLDRAGQWALLLGSEGNGLPLSLLERLETARIPMSTAFDSLNVGTASGIALAHFSRFR